MVVHAAQCCKLCVNAFRAGRARAHHHSGDLEPSGFLLQSAGISHNDRAHAQNIEKRSVAEWLDDLAMACESIDEPKRLDTRTGARMHWESHVIEASREVFDNGRELAETIGVVDVARSMGGKKHSSPLIGCSDRKARST